MKFVACYLFFIVIGSAPASAASQDENVGRKSISASRTPQTIEEVVVVAAKVARPVNRIAANVSVVTRDTIKHQLITSVADLFQTVPSIGVESAGNRFGNQSITVRGVGGNRVATLIDGVPLADHFSVGRFSNATRDFINTGFVNRAEVLHGPASSLYGSNAIGGVVALYTPDPVQLATRGEFGGEFVSTYNQVDDSRHYLGMVASNQESFGFVGAVSQRNGHQADPFEPPVAADLRQYQRRSVLLKLQSDQLAGQRIRTNYLHQDAHVTSDLHSMLGSGRFRSTTSLQGDDDAALDMLSLELELAALDQWFDSNVVRAYVQQTEFNQNTIDERLNGRQPQLIERDFFYQQKTKGLELNLQTSFQFAHAEHSLGFGVEMREKETNERRDASSISIPGGLSSNTVLGETFPLRDFPLSRTMEHGVYTEYTVSAGNWTVIGALRADWYDLDVKTDDLYLLFEQAAPVVELSESDISPKFGLIYQLGQRTDIYLQYSQGFRAPPFEDVNIGLDIPLFNVRAIPNPNLKSEASSGIDAGLRWTGAATRFRVSVFKTDYDDFIESKVRLGLDPASGRILFQSQNLSAAVIRGVEANWSWHLSDAISIDGAAYVAEGENRQTDEPLNSVGPAQLTLGVGWKAVDGKRAINLRARLVDAWNERDETAGEVFIPSGYSVFDVFYREALSPSLDFRAAIHNISNEQYWHWSAVRLLAPDDPSLSALTAPGRHFSVSMEWRW